MLWVAPLSRPPQGGSLPPINPYLARKPIITMSSGRNGDDADQMPALLYEYQSRGSAHLHSLYCEYQSRGSAHLHSFVWHDNAPPDTFLDTAGEIVLRTTRKRPGGGALAMYWTATPVSYTPLSETKFGKRFVI